MNIPHWRIQWWRGIRILFCLHDFLSFFNSKWLFESLNDPNNSKVTHISECGAHFTEGLLLGILMHCGFGFVFQCSSLSAVLSVMWRLPPNDQNPKGWIKVISIVRQEKVRNRIKNKKPQLKLVTDKKTPLSPDVITKDRMRSWHGLWIFFPTYNCYSNLRVFC